jgi:hypothetical protein
MMRKCRRIRNWPETSLRHLVALRPIGGMEPEVIAIVEVPSWRTAQAIKRSKSVTAIFSVDTSRRRARAHGIDSRHVYNQRVGGWRS